MKTVFIEPVSAATLPNLSQVKVYSTEKGTVTLFQNPRCPSQLFYKLLIHGQPQHLSAALEVEGLPSSQHLDAYLAKTHAQLLEQSDGQLKLRVHLTVLGGGFFEALVGAAVTAGGICAAAAAGTAAIPLAGAGALMGGGMSMFVTGVTRKKDEFDADFAVDALKGAAAGALTGGVLGGGVARAAIKKVAAQTFLQRQAVHAAVNGAVGVMRAGSDAAIDVATGRGAKAKENFTATNLVASAVGAAAGGLAGANVGNQTAQMGAGLLRTAATVVGGAVAGATAGAAAGATAAVAVNAAGGAPHLTQGMGAAAGRGASAGMMTGTSAAGHVAANRIAQAETARQAAQEQAAQPPRTEPVQQPQEARPEPAPQQAAQPPRTEPVQQPQEARPEPAPQQAAPQPQGQAAPQPQGQAAPQPQGQAAPQPQGQAAPQPQGQAAPQPQGQAAPQPQGQAVPAVPRESLNIARSLQRVDQRIEQLSRLQAAPALPAEMQQAYAREIERNQVLRNMLENPRSINEALDQIGRLQNGQFAVLPQGHQGQDGIFVMRQGNNWIAARVEMAGELINAPVNQANLPNVRVYDQEGLEDLMNGARAQLEGIVEGFAEEPLAQGVGGQFLGNAELERISEALQQIRQEVDAIQIPTSEEVLRMEAMRQRVEAALR